MKVLTSIIASLAILQLIIEKSLSTTFPTEKVCPIGKCAKCNMADELITCDACYYTLKNLQDGATPKNFFCEGEFDLDHCLQLQDTLGMNNISDPQKCNQCLPGYDMTTDQTFKCRLMKIQYCWYNAGNQHNSTVAIQNLYDNREKLGLYNYFEMTQLQDRGLKHLGFEAPELGQPGAPCIVCGPGYIASASGMKCDKIKDSEQIHACGLHFRDPADQNKIKCLLCINHYYLQTSTEGITTCGYNQHLSDCIDPNDLDANGNCKKCDPIKGNWAVGLSKDQDGNVIGNICEYKRDTDQLRVLWWSDTILLLMGTFTFFGLAMMIGCCIISNRTAKPPKGEEKMAIDNGLEGDSMVKSFIQRQEKVEEGFGAQHNIGGVSGIHIGSTGTGF